MKYFVSADIHGYYDEWMKALDEQGFDINNENHKVIVCGDLFDRGRKPKEIISFILSNPHKFILIRGNHEDIMENMIIRNYPTTDDRSNGTFQTIKDLYPSWQIREFNLEKIAKITKLQEILDMCINYYETEHYVFVHSWIPIDEYNHTYDPNWRDAHLNAWKKARWYNPIMMYVDKLFVPNKTIVCGHYSASLFWNFIDPINNPQDIGSETKNLPFIRKEMIALDACTFYSNFVNVVVLED